MITSTDFSSYEKLPIGIFITGLEMNFLYANQYACDMFGYTKEEALALNSLSMVTEEFIPVAQKSVQLRSQGLTPPATIYTGKRADNTTFPMQLEFIPQYYGESGELTGFLGIINDLTSTQAMQEEVSRSNKRYNLLMNSLGEIVVIAQEGRIVYGNHKALNAFGVDSRHISKVSFLEYIDPRDRELVATNYQKRLTDPLYHQEYQFRYLDAQKRPHWVKISSVLTTWNDKPATLSILTDIDERVHIMDQLNQEKQKAEKAVAMEARFLANVSHEIRTPMNGILGISSLLLETDLTQEQRHYMKMVQHSAQHLLHVINDVLDYSSLEAGKITILHKPFSFDECILPIKDSFTLQAHRRGILFSFQSNTPPGIVFEGDVTRLTQILANLLSNALKFTPEGSITLSIEYQKENKSVIFTIADTGLGIPLDAQEDIFLSFSQAENTLTRKHEGTGLGLSITKELVELMGGEISFTSTPSYGTTFTVTLPFEERTDHTFPHPPLATPLKDSYGFKVLIVEDNKVNAIVTQKFLEKLGCSCTYAESGSEALTLIKTHPFDLVLMDIIMPDMDGYTTTQKIREFQQHQKIPPTPIVAVTANAMAGDKEKCLQAGINYYISKPIEIAKLQEVLETIATTSPN